jgi:hypothetical protein
MSREAQESTRRPTTGEIRDAIDQADIIEPMNEQAEMHGIRRLVWHLKNRTKPT